MKRAWSASTRKHTPRKLSSSSDLPLAVHLTAGAGVPDTSHSRVVGCPIDLNTLGSPTSRTGAAPFSPSSRRRGTSLDPFLLE